MGGKSKLKDDVRAILNPAVSALARAGVTPMGVSILGLVASFVASILVARGQFRPGAIAVLVGGLCDVLDGMLARYRNTVSAFGAFMDSTLDRIAELAVLGGLIFFYARRSAPGGTAEGAFEGSRIPPGAMLLLAIIALGGSFLTSYTRARAEGLRLECKVGIAERPERVAILTAGLLASSFWLEVAIAVLAVLSTITSVQRIIHVRWISGGHN